MNEQTAHQKSLEVRKYPASKFFLGTGWGVVYTLLSLLIVFLPITVYMVWLHLRAPEIIRLGGGVLEFGGKGKSVKVPLENIVHIKRTEVTAAGDGSAHIASNLTIRYRNASGKKRKQGLAHIFYPKADYALLVDALFRS